MMSRQPVATASNYYHHHAAYAPQVAHGHYHDPAFLSVGYRPALQLPLQQQVPQHSAEQLSLAAGGFHHQNFRLHHQQPQSQQQQILPVRTRGQHRRQQQAMAQPPSQDEYAELQKLSNEYEPEATGPLVGQREPSTNITTEYASADQAYQIKTADLPSKYSHYRKVRGDGRCGWRAIAFGYFEALIRLGDYNKFLEELARLRSLTNVLNQAGFASFLWEDFADEAYILLDKLSQSLQTGTAEDELLEAFNDDTIQNYIVTYLRTLTAAWMKMHPGDYSPWLLGQTVDQYIEAYVLPVASELENVSLGALKDVLLSPVGISLEVIYLDRSQGKEVNTHRFDPVNAHGNIIIGHVRLLYRPGHYDILYRAEDFPQPAAIPTYLQFASQHQNHFHDIGGGGFDFMTNIPGMSFVNPHQAWESTSNFGGPDFFAAAAPVQQCAAPVPVPTPAPAPQPTPSAQPHIQPQPVYVPATPTHVVAPPIDFPQELAIRTVPQAQATMAPPSFQHEFAGPFRPSAWQLEGGFVQATAHTPYQTSIFRNSHFNTAHYLNPEFQPEEWRPDEEYVTTNSGKSSRHRNSG